MRKFNVRWWDGPNLQNWIKASQAGDYPHPFALWPYFYMDLDKEPYYFDQYGGFHFKAKIDTSGWIMSEGTNG